MADLLPPREILPPRNDLTREQFAIMLGAINFRAKREVPKVGSDEHPTPWDLIHKRLNDLITDMGL